MDFNLIREQSGGKKGSRGFVQAGGGGIEGRGRRTKKKDESGWHEPQARRMGGCGRREIFECVTSEGIRVTYASTLSYDLDVTVHLGSELTSLHLP